MSMKHFVNLVCCHFLYHVHYKDLESLQKYEQCLICPNHSNIFDPFFIYPVSHNLSIMAKAELFRYKLLGKLLKHYHVFPVDRTKKDPGSLFHALEIFHTKEPRQLLIFPEGGVIKTEEQVGKKVRNGATFIAAKLQIPIVPVFITRRPKLFSKVEVIFGNPFFINPSVLEDKSNLKIKSKEIIQKIYELKRK